ncbi:MAG: hypothetical protein KQJ78_06700 [Deltaproteobacteria bacterium]|nr:hypothetical protein [Deltaproteobacteria bacterium]
MDDVRNEIQELRDRFHAGEALEPADLAGLLARARQAAAGASGDQELTQAATAAGEVAGLLLELGGRDGPAWLTLLEPGETP